MAMEDRQEVVVVAMKDPQATTVDMEVLQEVDLVDFPK